MMRAKLVHGTNSIHWAKSVFPRFMRNRQKINMGKLLAEAVSKFKSAPNKTAAHPRGYWLLADIGQCSPDTSDLF
jgi:hypothetical protein